MRYASDYNDQAKAIERRGSVLPSERDWARANYRRITDNHSGSGQDSRERDRMERISQMGSRW